MSSVPLTRDTPAQQPGMPGPARRRIGSSNPQAYALIFGVTIALASLSLLLPSTPSYDPWSWLVWGREILHGGLHTQGGPTWKPLPVMLTTVLAIFGKAQPDLWLIVARSGGLLAVIMTGRLAGRFTLWLAAPDGEVPPNRRLGVWAPAVLAALLAGASLAWSGSLLSSTALGYSEALAIAALAIAIDRMVDGHHRQAFAIGFAAALLRPEAWVVWGPYGLWLMWKDKGARAMVLSLGLLTLALWFVPQKLGGGSFVSGVARAHHPRSNSPAFAPCPICSEIFNHAWNLVILRTKVAALLAMAIAAWTLLRGRLDPSSAVTGMRRKAVSMILASGLLGYGWWVIVGLETQAGFSGNDRYLVIGSAFIVLCAGAGFGWAAVRLTELAGAWRRTGMLSTNLRGGLATLLAALVFVLVPNWFGQGLLSLPASHRALVYQANLRSGLAAFIKRMGGPRGLQRCGAGHIMVEGFQVPMMSWMMNERLANIESPPPYEFNTDVAAKPPKGYIRLSSDVIVQVILNPPWPNVIMQDRDTGGAHLLPTWETINHWQHLGARYRIYTTKEIRFFVDCAPQPNDPKASITS